MLLNYIKLSLRLMARNPFFTSINVVGLGIGFASFFALWNFSISELQTDQYHKDYERIARIGWYWRWTDDGEKWEFVTTGFSKSDIPIRLKEDFGEVEAVTRIHTQPFFGSVTGPLVPHRNKITMSVVSRSTGDIIFKEEQVIYADKNLFNFFSIPLIRGKANDVLTEAGSVVLSESQAKKYFGQSNPVGELIRLNETITLKVTGVFKDLPHNTHLNFNVVISNTAYLKDWATAYIGQTMNYVRLKEGSSFSDFEKKINGRKKDYFATILNNIPNSDHDLFVQPLKEIALGQGFVGDEFGFRSKSLLTTFAIVSIVILAMAWINYINLWIARNKKRNKELATRKINGARGKDFIFQFITESAIVNLFAILFAITLLQFSRSPFQHFFNIHIHELWELDAMASLICLLVILLSIGITGLYPGFVARNDHPLSLFGRSGNSGSGSMFSSGLVVFQFTAAITLILWSSIIYYELSHVLNHEIGLDRTNVVVLEIPFGKNGIRETHLDRLVNQLVTNSSIEQAAYSLCIPGEIVAPPRSVRRPGSVVQIGFEWNGVNENYIPLFDLKLLAGRNFVKDDLDNVMIISRVATQRLGFENPADAIGTRWEIEKDLNQWQTVELVGVMEDYRTLPFFETSAVTTDLKNEYQSKGIMFTFKNKGAEFFQAERLAMKIKPVDFDKTMAAVEEEFKAVYPGSVFSWFFLEDSMNKLYSNEKIIRNQIVLFVMLAMIIACLGFQGMITHKVTSRTKEIGIRKVLGARMSHISKIILQPSSLHFGISLVIGVPIAWYLGQQYLQKFSERIELQWWHFAMPVLILVMIMFLTIASLLWRAAKSNPVEALKYE